MENLLWMLLYIAVAVALPAVVLFVMRRRLGAFAGSSDGPKPGRLIRRKAPGSESYAGR